MVKKVYYFVAGAVAAVAATYVAIRPKEVSKGVFSPSWLTISTFTASTTDYTNDAYTPYTGDLKVLVVCTEKADLTMANGAKFHTGNHPVETFVPMLHLSVRELMMFNHCLFFSVIV